MVGRYTLRKDDAGMRDVRIGGRGASKRRKLREVAKEGMITVNNNVLMT